MMSSRIRKIVSLCRWLSAGRRGLGCRAPCLVHETRYGPLQLRINFVRNSHYVQQQQTKIHCRQVVL